MDHRIQAIAVDVIVPLLLFLAIWLFVRLYYAWPAYPPLQTEPDDPVMQEARKAAKVNLPQFLTLYPDNRERAIVKIKFISNSEQVEYLWGEVRDIRDGKADIFLITPPVTHSGRLERGMTVNVADLDDWQITDKDGKIYGAYSQKAMLKLARQRWGKLPKKLEKIEKLYS